MKKTIVVLTGAGISAESGLKTFRDSDGLWEGFDVQEVATPGAWRKNPARVLEFYNQRRRDIRTAVPNQAHFILAGLEEYFNVRIITQNIDDLHERADSTNVVHLHGEILKMRSERDDRHHYPISEDILLGHIAPDGGQLRPHIVWFEEPVPLIGEAANIVQHADIFVIVGTSLAVYPAAGLVGFANHDIPKFIVDRSIPSTRGIERLQAIQKPATTGMAELRDILMDYQ